MTRTRVIYDPIRYGFAVGRVRVLETRLLSRATFERLLDAHTFDQMRRILADTVYGGYLEMAHTAEGVERGLDAALADLYDDFLEHANLPRPLIDYFRTRHDFENLTAYLKAEALDTPAEELLNRFGSVPAEAFAGPRERLPERVRDAERRVRAAVEKADGSLDPDAVEDAVDTELFTALGEIARESGSDFLARLFRLEADIGNVRAFVRARARMVPVAEVERRFVPGGSIALPRLVSIYRLPPAEAALRLGSHGAFAGVDAAAIADPARFDVEAARLVARVVRTSRMTAMGPEPVVGYVMERQAEVRALRTLLVGSLAGVPADRLRERIRCVV